MDQGAPQMIWEAIDYFWQQLTFLTPWMLVFLPLPWIIQRLWQPAPQQQIPLLAPHLQQRLEAFHNAQLSVSKQRPLAMPILGALIWLLVLLAAMRPVWYWQAEPFQVSGKNLMLAVDLSGSMEQTDMRIGADPVDRLTAVKKVVQDFIQKRQGDRMGLVVFGTQAFLQSPLSFDLNTVKTLLNETEIGMAGNNTAIGDAIGVTLKHLAQTQQSNTVLILLTDGSNTAGVVEPLDAARQAKKMGLKIYTIGVGVVANRGLDQLLFGQNRSVDTATLKTIADLSGGQFYPAANLQQLNDIYNEINQLESTEQDRTPYRPRTELYPWPLATAFIISLLMALYRLYKTRHYD